MTGDDNTQGFKRVLGRWDSVAIIIAIVIGVGIFRVPAEVGRYLSSPGFILLAWLLGGIISLFGALCYAELSSSFPKTGGNYIYLRESYGPSSAFLYGWSELLAIRTGSIAAISFIFAEYLCSFLSVSNSLVKPFAICAVFALSFINIIGLRHGRRVQSAFTILKVLALLGILFFGFLSGKGNVSHLHSAAASHQGGIIPLFGLALIPILWTYGGWHENTFVAEETKDARKSLPFALITGIFTVTLLYLAINAMYIYLIPTNEIANATLIGSDALQVLWGENGRKIFEAVILISAIGSINSMIITGSRITYAMAKDNAIFRFAGKIDNKYGTPNRAIIINACLSIVFIILGTFNKLLFFTGILVWLFFALAAGSVFVLRRKFPGIERPYKVLGYPLTPALFILISVGLAINTAIFYPYESLAGLGFLACGIPAYLISRRRNHK